MTENAPFTAKSEDGAETRIITHTNGDRTVVPGDVDDELAAQLAQLSGADIADAIDKARTKKHAEQDKRERDDARRAVLADPPETTAVSTSPLAGPDPVRQGGTSSDGEGGAGSVFPTTVPAPGFRDAETVKATEAADPDGGVTPVDEDGEATGRDEDDEPRTVGPNV
jgi:hypothetical protein